MQTCSEEYIGGEVTHGTADEIQKHVQKRLNVEMRLQGLNIEIIIIFWTEVKKQNKNTHAKETNHSVNS